MIEVNLLPGAKRRKRRPALGASLSLPSLPTPASLDRWTLGIAACWIIGPALLAWMFLGPRNRKAELDLAIERAVADSTRYAAVIEDIEQMRARRDTIARKLQVIQQIDAGRYIWPHILDEISRAVPDYTWLTELDDMGGDSLPTFQVRGRTGNNFALTRFMKELEASPFVRRVRLASTELVRVEKKLVHAFVLEASYQEPPPGMIKTTPLFIGEENHGTLAE